MPVWLAKGIAWLLEAVVWFCIGLAPLGEIMRRPGRMGWETIESFYMLIPFAFALLGPPLWRRYGLPKWYRGP